MEGEPDAAAFVLRDLATRAPLDRHARLLLAWALGLAGRTEEQDEEWKAVAALAPGFETQTRPDLTRRFERIRPSERPFEAEKDTRTRTELAASLLARAQRLHDSGDAEGAMKEATRSAYLDPGNRRTHLLMARLYRLRGDHELVAQRVPHLPVVERRRGRRASRWRCSSATWGGARKRASRRKGP